MIETLESRQAMRLGLALPLAACLLLILSFAPGSGAERPAGRDRPEHRSQGWIEESPAERGLAGREPSVMQLPARPISLNPGQSRGADMSRCRADAQAQGLAGVELRQAIGRCMNPAAATTP